ncbi:ARL14 effector protein [Nilaparvata lugens]|uniref:ARL14 effector protein n=1 Tax=Nilaparvata lugens TaxID=108931 RepID=UPI000B989E0A|nr:ARL14 effector protein [Nilaparvata lugens]
MTDEVFPRLSKELKEKMKFMEDFNPERSDRERRKLTKKILSHTRAMAPNSVYNEFGVHVASGRDMCDCFSSSCPGCFLPCPKCRSSKCGIDCRVNRKWSYDLYHIEGIDLRRTNKLKDFEKVRNDLE